MAWARSRDAPGGSARRVRAIQSQRRVGFTASLQKLRRQVGPVHRDVTVRAVAVTGLRQVMEGGRLGAKGPRPARLRVAGKAELVDARPEEHLRVVRAVGLVAGETGAARAGDVVEDERPAHLGV